MLKKNVDQMTLMSRCFFEMEIFFFEMEIFFLKWKYFISIAEGVVAELEL